MVKHTPKSVVLSFSEFRHISTYTHSRKNKKKKTKNEVLEDEKGRGGALLACRTSGLFGTTLQYNQELHCYYTPESRRSKAKGLGKKTSSLCC